MDRKTVRLYDFLIDFEFLSLALDKHHRELWQRLSLGNHLTASIGDTRLNWTDDNAPYLNGQIGFANFAGCHTAFERVEIRPNSAAA